MILLIFIAMKHRHLIKFEKTKILEQTSLSMQADIAFK